MDSNAFDQLARTLGAPASRRRALGALTAGGLFGALGRGHGTPARAALAAQVSCTYDFVTTVRTGPSASEVLTNDATTPGEVRGQLTFGLTDTGALSDAALLLADGTALPVVGQATGNSLQLRINAGPDLVFVHVGVGEQAIAACQGAVDGVSTGPQVGDLGDWHAVALGASGASGGQGSGRVRISGSGTSGTSGTGGATGALSGGSGGTGSGSGSGSGSGTGSGSGSGSGGTIPPDAAGNCPTGTTNCAATCVNLQTDAANCGQCDNACPEDQTCTAGACTAPADECPTGQTDCGGTCVDTQTDQDNCGTCGTRCPVTPSIFDCIAGVCTPPDCGDGLTDCSGLCVNLQNDPLGCGTCGNVCAEGQTCVNGACTAAAPPAQTCPGGQENCFGVCTDTSNDANNCGACGVPCGPGLACQSKVCVAGVPACAAGLVACRGVCVDTNNDAFNCGSCDFACPPGQACANGICLA